MGRVGLPKVVTTATSVCADLEDKQQQAENKDQQQADNQREGIAFHGNYLVLGGGTVRSSRLCGDLILQVEREDIVGVGGEQNVFARVGGGAGEGLQIGPLGIDRRRGLKGGNLVGEQGGLGQRADFARGSLGVGLVQDAGGLRPGQRVGPDVVRAGRQDLRLLGLDGRDDLFVVRRDFHRRMQVLQANGDDPGAQPVLVGRRLDAVGRALAPPPAGPAT